VVTAKCDADRNASDVLLYQIERTLARLFLHFATFVLLVSVRAMILHNKYSDWQEDERNRMARFITIVSMLPGVVGIYLGFYYLADDPNTALAIVTATTVGITGVIAFVRHVIFHKSDAKRLGWETDRPDWMFEVGFANLAFGVMGLLPVFLHWGGKAYALVLFGYALYLFQAALLHGYRYATDEKRSPARLWRSCLTTLLYAGMLAYFGSIALTISTN